MAEEERDLDEIEKELEEVSSSTSVSQVMAEDERTRIPLSYDNAEEVLLSMFIQDDTIATLIAQSGLRDAHFSKKKNRILFPILLDVRLKKGACSFDLVADACEKSGLPDGRSHLEEIGGLGTLTDVIQSTPEVIDIKVAQAYIDLVFEQYRLSKVKEIARWIAGQKKFDEVKLVDKLTAIQQVLIENINKYGLSSLDELLLDSYERFKDKKENPEQYKAIPTGFYWLTKCKAVAKKRTTVIGARTSRGKSLFASQIITEMVLNDYMVLLFTPELDKEEYVDRLICSYAEVDLDRWKDASISGPELDKLAKYRDRLLQKAPRNLFIEDRGSQTCSFILNSIRKHILNHRVDVVVVDYLQKIKYYGDNTKKAITDIMERFSSFAKDNNIAFIVISQLRRSDKEAPVMEELKESGDIENFADCVILLHRNSLTKMGEKEKGWYRIDKNRQGRTTDDVALSFNETCVKFKEVNIPEEGVESCESWISDEEQDMLTEQEVMDEVKKLNGVSKR